MRGRSGLASPDPESLLTLSVLDPTDGRSHEVLLRFLRGDGRLYVLAVATPRPRWLAAALAAPRVHWRIGQDSYEGIASEHDDAAAIRSRFESAFGRERISGWFGTDVTSVALEPCAPSAAGYHAEVEGYFDRASPQYDQLVAANPLDRFLRSVSLEILQGSFRRGDRVLEIGSGTGLETLPLASAGIEVVAVDISAGMIDRLQSKAAAAGVSARVHPRRMAAEDLSVLEQEYGTGTFQGAFSTFGALNCEPAWRDLAPVLARLLTPRATLVLGVWNRVCLFELGAYALSGRPRRALARLRSPVPVGLTRFGVPVYASTVGEFLQAFSSEFEVRSIYGLPVALPPYDLSRHVPNPDAVLPLLAGLDGWLRPRFPFNRLGDHFVLVLRRR